MKVAYLGKIQLSDADLSYLHSAQQTTDITYIMEVTPRFLKGPAYNIQKIFPSSGIFKATDAYPEFAKLSGFIDTEKFYIVNTCGKLWMLKAFWTNFLLLLFLIRQKFDVIHLTWPANIYEFIIYFLRRKMVLTVHDPFPHTGLDTRIVRLRRWVAFRVVPKFIILNDAQREKFLSFYGLSGERVESSRLSCYSYLNITDVDASSLPRDKEYILFAGKISPYKGVGMLLSAMQIVHERYPNVVLIVAGVGKYPFDKSPYEKLSYVDIRNRFIPDAELVALIKNALFLVCPYTDATQSGVVMSAFAFATPVIATQVGGLPQMLDGGRFGSLVKPKDVAALADSIISLLGNRQILEKYRKEIETAYGTQGQLSWMTIAKEIKTVYKGIAGK